eukprot:m.44057 g.44057  ORF g.44057 m.44057 type:complete len:119 (+) comp10583_c0_seq1:1054-1410(+)
MDEQSEQRPRPAAQEHSALIRQPPTITSFTIRQYYLNPVGQAVVFVLVSVSIRSFYCITSHRGREGKCIRCFHVLLIPIENFRLFGSLLLQTLCCRFLLHKRLQAIESRFLRKADSRG